MPGMWSRRVGRWMVQCYWPILHIDRNGFYFVGDMRFRVSWERGYRGVAFALLGIGAGVIDMSDITTARAEGEAI